jgi:hypothetical protein
MSDEGWRMSAGIERRYTLFDRDYAAVMKLMRTRDPAARLRTAPKRFAMTTLRLLIHE